MDYRKIYDRYSICWYKTEKLRAKGFAAKHLFSIPWQIGKKIASKGVIRGIDKETVFPDIQKQGDQNVIVSLTSFPFRIPRIHLVIRSLLKQDYLPGKICLWLSVDEFPGGKNDLPEELKELQIHGLEINFVPENYRSYRKFFYAFRRFPDKIVITVDDDIIYHPETVGRLMDLHRKFPDAICAHRVRRINLTENEFAPYRAWKRIFPDHDIADFLLSGIGYGGVLYPPARQWTEKFDPCNAELFRQLAPMADDLWLKASQILNDVEVATGSVHHLTPVYIPGSQKVSLKKINDGMKRNDVQWKQLDEHFGLQKIIRERTGLKST